MEDRAPPRARAPDMGIGRAALVNGIASLATIAASVARGKVTALVLGPTGVGMASEILQVVALAGILTSLTTSAAYVAGLVEAHRVGDDERTRLVYRSAWGGTWRIAIPSGLVAVGLGYVVLPGPWGPGAWPLVASASLTMIGTAMFAVCAQLVTARGRLSELATMNVMLAAVQTLFVVAATPVFGLAGQLVGMAIGTILVLPFAHRIASRTVDGGLVTSGPFDRDFLRAAVRTGLATLGSAAAAQVMLSAVRIILDRVGGVELNGQFQAAWTMGSMYFQLALGSLGAYVFPRYAAATAEELSGEIDAAARFVFGLLPSAMIAAICLRQPVIAALYSDRFDQSAGLLALIFVGDLARALVWLQAGPLLYRGRIRAYLATEFVSVSLMVGAVAALVPFYGLFGVGLGYVLVSVINIAQSAWILRRSCGVPVRWKWIGISAFSVVVGALVFFIVEEISWLRWPISATALAWTVRRLILDRRARAARAAAHA